MIALTGNLAEKFYGSRDEANLPPRQRVVARLWRRTPPGSTLTTILMGRGVTVRGDGPTLHVASGPKLFLADYGKRGAIGPGARLLFARATLSIATGIKSEIVADYVPEVARMAYGDEGALVHDGIVHVL
jgi:hypothetical protein